MRKPQGAGSSWPKPNCPTYWRALAQQPALIVLDIEARSDNVARKLARRTSGGLPLLFREIVSVSCLRLATGSQPGWRLMTFHREDDLTEAQLLLAVDREVQSAVAEGAVMVTFNGAEHDLPLIRARQVRWWQCSSAGLVPYLDGSLPHVDVMRDLTRSGRRYARLTDACASIGISLFGPSRLEIDRELPVEQEKGELDVVGTALVYFFLLADRLASDQALLDQLDKFGEYLKAQVLLRPHLKAVAANPVFSLAQKFRATKCAGRSSQSRSGAGCAAGRESGAHQKEI